MARQLSAKQLYSGSNPLAASTKFSAKENLVDTQASAPSESEASAGKADSERSVNSRKIHSEASA